MATLVERHADRILGEPDPDAAIERKERRFSASCDGFDVHCAVRVAAPFTVRCAG